MEPSLERLPALPANSQDRSRAEHAIESMLQRTYPGGVTP